MRDGGIWDQMDGVGRDFRDLIFEGPVQRRGADVNIPEIGSRVGQLCFGGISGFYAVL
jgi:hypothetical protein